MNQGKPSDGLTEALIKSIFVQQRNSNILMVIFILALGWGIVNRFLERGQSYVSSIAVSEAKIIGSNVLCPGEILQTKIHLKAEGSGIIIRDMSTQSVDGHKTLAVDENFRYPFSNLIDQDIPLSWLIPEVYLNMETGKMEPFPPGEYVRNISFTGRGNDSTVFDMANLKFTIPEICFTES